MLLRLKHSVKAQPHPMIRFLSKAFGWIMGWELIYGIWLRPRRIPDEYLTRLTADVTAGMISFLIKPARAVAGSPGYLIWMDHRKILGIADGCNGLVLFLIYTAFLLCYPLVSWRRLLVFLTTGLITLFLLNVTRCTAIAWLNLNAPGLAHFAHHYAFVVVVYSAIFYGWVLYVNNGRP